jgi:hypothetical protein
MITQVLHCPNCHGTDIVKHGKSPEGKQRYKCRETACDRRTFILDYAYPGQSRGCETADCGYGSQWQWGARYSAGFTCESQYCNSRIKKKNINSNK